MAGEKKEERQSDPLDKLLSMSYQDLLLPVITSGTLMLICFYIGHYQFSIMWIFLLTALYLLKTRLWVKRQQDRLEMRKQILRERGAIGTSGMTNKDLPNWIRYPDAERVEWLNQILQQMWPFICDYSASFMREFVEPQVLAQMPSPFKSFRFVDIDMGDVPLRVSGLKVYTQNVGRDKIIVDLDVAYAGDAEYKVNVCGFTGGMNEIVLSGRLRCILQPLIPKPPMVASMSGSFVELPKFDFNLTGMGDFLQLPLLSDAIRSVINTQLANMAVLPNTMIIPLVPDINITSLFTPLPDALIRIKIVEAKNLENKDVSFITKDKSDPYCELQLGSQLFKTRTINNNLNPKFDEYFEAVVDQTTAQKLRIHLFDQDTAGKDEELGHLSVPMTFVEKNKVVSKWFNLESCKHGDIYLKLFWCQLSTSPLSSMQPIPYETEWKTANKPVHSILMIVFVDNAKDLPLPKSNVEPSPFFELTFANATQRTPIKARTSNPVYQSKFIFLIKESSKDLQALNIKAVDSNTSKSLGEMNIPLSSILDQSDMEVIDKIYQMQHGIHTSSVTLSIRYIIPPNEETDFSNYANSSYVERAKENFAIRTSNGDAFAPEPGKRPEVDHIHHPESESQLNTSRFMTINRRPSDGSTGSSRQTSKGLKDKFLRFRKSKDKRPSNADLGTIEYALRYNEHANSIVFDVISAHNLMPHTQQGKISPYVSVKLFHQTPNGVFLKTKRNTNIIENSLNPMFDNRFEFDVDPEHLNSYYFLLVVKDNQQHGLLSKPISLGQTEVWLTDFSKSDSLRHKANLVMP